MEENILSRESNSAKVLRQEHAYMFEDQQRGNCD